MYGEKNIPIPQKVTEHSDLAQKMAQEIIERFNPIAQNECLTIIHDLVKEARQKQLEQASENVAFLTKSLENL